MAELDFYTTLAQVLPVLLLTIVWDRDYLDEPRTRNDADVVFWTRNIVRWYSVALSTILILGIAICLLVLARVLPDADWVRGGLTGVTALALLTLSVRIGARVVQATTT
ncbi:hypothetical protein [Geodermatophilus sp. URMC 62]|uniref:hypothetical protein n=1 Tax=Geodermatophilus sp. URMC 62 TaxID=3423414 RepID=UPI00406D1E82